MQNSTECSGAGSSATVFGDEMKRSKDECKIRGGSVGLRRGL
jgi:hypothetical protein